MSRIRRGTVLTFTVYILHTGHAACCLYSFHLALATPCASARTHHTILTTTCWGVECPVGIEH